ncbi:hypothetical protein [Bradyrhizobium sp. CCBAU 53340]|uniref:hypothetical protein n=1 Tax=Bradyrhizobium sp. CCBAU 53340 TaxID=1325112 RepID=UPI00188D3155|nr:hypothetical protein [Bradyrhizobium sp. CCBAU 53340]
MNPLIIVGRTFDNRTALEASAERQTTVCARQMRLSLTACGSGNSLDGFTIVGSMMQRAPLNRIDL